MSGENEKMKGRVGAELLDVIEEGDEEAGLTVPSDTMLDDASEVGDGAGDGTVDNDEGLKIPDVNERSSSASSTNWQGSDKMYVSFIFLLIITYFSYILHVRINLYHNTYRRIYLLNTVKMPYVFIIARFTDKFYVSFILLRLGIYFHPALILRDNLQYNAFRRFFLSTIAMMPNDYINANFVDKMYVSFTLLGLVIYCPSIPLLILKIYYNDYRRSSLSNIGKVPNAYIAANYMNNAD
jgi:hypothetical protein